ncbi:MAG: RNA polymerase sigma factor [Salibacteraceae bacterium]
MKNKSEDLEDIISRCKKGDRRAQNEVFQLYFGKMSSVCRRYISDLDESQDAVQTGFIKVFSNIHKYNGEGSFEGWVRRIMSNTAIDLIRKKKNVFVSVDATDYDWLAEQENEEASWNITLTKETDRVMKEIQNLSPAYRLVFNMYVIEDYSHNEISEILGISVGTSKSNLSKAKRNLLKNLVKLEEY